jgi:hypothetical protein
MRRPYVSAALFAVAGGVIALVAKANLFPFMSGDADESVYIYQGRMLAERHSTLAARVHAPFLYPWLFGERGGTLFSQYQPGWPAVIAVGRLFGSEQIALVVAAAAAVLATWWLAREVSPRAAPYAAALFLISPIFVVHSGLFLSYLWTTALVMGATAAALAGLRNRHWLPFLASGVLFGVAQLVRPLDALLVAVPVGIYVVLALWGHWDVLRRAALVMAIGIAPLLLVTLVYNAHITGSPLHFPLQAAERLDTFGFGLRRMAAGEPTIDYTRHVAFEAFRVNTVAIPRWVAGGFVGLALALGAVVLNRRRHETWLLLVLVAIFPIAYTSWWATTLAAGAARAGLGPHYYVPIFVPLCVLAGWCISDLVARWRGIGVGALAVAVIATGFLYPAVLDDAHFTTDIQRAKHAPFARSDLQNAVVVLRADPARFILSNPTFAIGNPDLTGDRIYAIDRGPDTVALQQQFPDRQLYQYVLRTEPGRPLLSPSFLLEPLKIRRGPVVTLHYDLINTSGAKTVLAAVQIDDRTVASQTVATDSHKGAGTTLDVALVAPGATPPAPGPGLLIAHVADDTTVHVVAGFGPDENIDNADLVERRYYVARRGDDLAVQQPGQQYHLYRVHGDVWAAQDVDANLHER